MGDELTQVPENKPDSGTPAAPAASSSSSDSSQRRVQAGTSYEEGAAALAPGGTGYEEAAASLSPNAQGSGGGGSGTSEAAAPRKVLGRDTYGVSGQSGSLGKGKRGAVAATGRGFGDREDDVIDAKSGKRKAATVTNPAAAVDRPDLSVIKEHKRTVDLGDGPLPGQIFVAGRLGAGSKSEGPGSLNHKGEVDLAKWQGAAGAQGRIGWTTGEGKLEGEYGTGYGEATVQGIAEGGISGDATINHEGVNVHGAIGGQIGIQADGKIGAKTKGLKIDGVDDEVTAGAELGGEVFAGGRLGAGGTLAFDPMKGKAGAYGKAGAFIGVEGKAHLRGHVGPVTAEGNVSGFVGAGAGIEGGIYYENGTIHIGGRMYAAAGYGVGVGGKVEINLKQAYQLMTAAGKAAYRAADADGDGELTANDAAEHAGQGLDNAAKGVDSAVKSTLDFLDAKQDGKLDSHDIKAARDAAVNYVTAIPGKVTEAATQMGEQAGQAFDDAVDWGAEQGQRLVKGGQALYKSIDTDGKEGISGQEMMDAAGRGASAVAKRVGEGIDSAVDTGAAAIKQVSKAGNELLDVTGDKQFDSKDIQHLYNEGVKRGQAFVDARAKEISAAADAAEKSLTEAYNDAKDYLLTDDGDLDIKRISGDASKAVSSGIEHARKTVKTVRKRVSDGIEHARQRGAQAVEQVRKQAAEVQQYALGKDGQFDGDDVRRMAADAGKRVDQVREEVGRRIDSATEAVGEYASSVGASLEKAGETFMGHAQSARKTVSSTISTVRSYLPDLNPFD